MDLLWLPMSHVFGWGEFCLGNQLGFLTYFSDPLSVLPQLQELRPHIFMSVPAYWEKLAAAALAAGDDRAAQLAELKRVTGGRLSFCLSGGAGLRREVKELFLEAGILIIEGYGLTECSPTLTMNRHDDYDFDTVGKPFPGVELKLAEDGEILARGQNVFCRLPQGPGRHGGDLRRAGLAQDRRPGPLQRGGLFADHRAQEGDPGHRRAARTSRPRISSCASARSR